MDPEHTHSHLADFVLVTQTGILWTRLFHCQRLIPDTDKKAVCVFGDCWFLLPKRKVGVAQKNTSEAPVSRFWRTLSFGGTCSALTRYTYLSLALFFHATAHFMKRETSSPHHHSLHSIFECCSPSLCFQSSLNYALETSIVDISAVDSVAITPAIRLIPARCRNAS